MCVLGCLILDDEHVVQADIIKRLRPEHFYDDRHRKIYRGITTLFENGGCIDLTTLRDRLKRDGTIDEVGGVDYLIDITNATPSIVNGPHYAEEIHDCYARRMAIMRCQKIAGDAYDIREPLEGIGRQFQKALLELTDSQQTGDAKSAQQLVPAVLDQLQSRKHGELPGVSTGFFEFDVHTGGLCPGDLIIVAGRPSMGKTAFALNMVEYITVFLKVPTLVLSLEMSSHQLIERLLSSVSGMDGYHIKRGYLSDFDHDNLKDAGDALQAAPLYIDDQGGLSSIEVIAKAKSAVYKWGTCVLVIDYLQLMRGEGYNQNNIIADISRSMKALAKELHIPVVLISQLSRGTENREEKRPRMSDLRDSGSIEQDADLICMLYREDYYRHNEKDYAPTHIAEVIIAKNRNGPTGTVKLRWSGELTKFSNME
jgi:replicative DNA helicase